MRFAALHTGQGRLSLVDTEVAATVGTVAPAPMPTPPIPGMPLIAAATCCCICIEVCCSKSAI